jgi:threonine-phosphate decarboxylase
MALLKSVHGGNIAGGRAAGHLAQLLDFSANINPLGMPESLKRAIDNMACAERYPDVEYQQLHLALAEHHQIPASWILAGNGETEAIFTLVHG